MRETWRALGGYGVDIVPIFIVRAPPYFNDLAIQPALRHPAGSTAEANCMGFGNADASVMQQVDPSPSPVEGSRAK
jgi:hypothetical protein